MEKAIEIKDVSKQFGNHKAVENITFDIQKGSIFGMLGPNGAGKTTLIRMITGITAPDSGSVWIHGHETNLVNNANMIGYMPEERGLYKKMKVEEQAIYLGQLKGLSYSDSKSKVNHWFEKLDMSSWKNKKVEELSKGMHQKLQFVCTVLHQPSIIILDEPFSGLDPMNAEVIKQEIFELAQNGATIIFSTHRMEQVEEICNHIVLINKGKLLLNSTVDEARSTYKTNKYQVILQPSDIQIRENNNIFELIERKNNKITIKLIDFVKKSQFFNEMESQGLNVSNFAEDIPNLNTIFIQLVQNQ